MIGQSPEAVTVKPNLSFVDATLTPEQAASLVSLWQNGAIAYETLYENLERGEIASAEREHEAEMKVNDEEGFGGEEERLAAATP